jgi:glycolate oxidase FAD binding subunit
MTSGDALDALRVAVGSDAVVEHEPVLVDGVRLAASLRPGSAEQLGEGLRVLSQRGMAALVRGGGSRLGQGNRLQGADLVLETAGLDGILELDAEDGSVHVRAGTRIATLREAARAEGWELPLDPPGERSSVGGALASAAVGPRFGHPRSVVLGLEVALASGARTRCGGRVVKNVTGYDLAKLYIGCFGSLGVIEAAWLRLLPLPERSLFLGAPLPDGAAGFGRALAAARRPSARVAARLDGALAAEIEPAAAGGGGVLLLELVGDQSALEADRSELVEEIGAREVDPAVIERLRAVQGGTFHRGGLRLRVSALPSRLGEAVEGLAGAGGTVLSYPARGLVYAWFPAGLAADERAVHAALRSAGLAATAGGGGLVIEEAPDSVKEGRDVFGDPGSLLPLFRALKHQYDPKGVLNPGRFAGCL